jgi:hypothetical protein
VTTENLPPLPCPFCNGCGVDVERGPFIFETRFYVRCRWCRTEGPRAETEERAVRKWNTRAIASSHAAPGDAPPLPEPAASIHDDGYWNQNQKGPLAALPFHASRRGDVFTADQMNERYREGYQAAAASQVAPKWTTEVPTRAGAYWVKEPGNPTWTVAHVWISPLDGHWEASYLCDSDRIWDADTLNPGTRWSGPIQPPSEE